MHPVFLTHPITGRKVLYCNPGYAERINELDAAESTRMLDFLFAHQLQPKYQHIVDTCEPYLVSYPGNHGALDLRPFGLPVAFERLYDPTTLRSRRVVDGLHYLDAFSFGGENPPRDTTKSG